MANEKKNMNELVIDGDEPTAGLETLEDTCGLNRAADDADAPSLNELRTDLRDRSQTIDRLQFDIEQLRARWMGLEAELKSREALTKQLNDKLRGTEDKLAGSEKLLAEREQYIEELLEERANHRSSPPTEEEQDQQRKSGRLACAQAEIVELRNQLERIEAYADSMRRRLQEQEIAAGRATDTSEALRSTLDRRSRRIEELELQVVELQKRNNALETELGGITQAHAEEIRIIRFELGEAQETMAQQELVTEQLASDLVDTRGYRDELEKMLTQTEEKSQVDIDRLERDNRRLRDELQQSHEQLGSKNEAINCLLAELARKSKQIESIEEIEDVIHEIGDGMSDRVEERTRRERDRMSRVLIGVVDGQELRFPLFKDRLTIGRTEHNDVQLKAAYVSRRHAVIVTEQDTTRVIDWGSKNGVYVNAERITEHFLRNGDKLTIGSAEFRYEERPKRDA
jgi:predicted  nucleic acid-binding Zn-ribbon protein